MLRRTTLAAVALALVVAGCGQTSNPRAAVATYLTRVNKLERALVHPLSVVTSTGRQFAKEQRNGGTLTNLLPAAHRDALLRALARLDAVRARLAALKAPAAAMHLRSLLLRVIDVQAGLTREEAQLVIFLPAYAKALAPLAPVTRRLEATLSQQTAYGQAAVAAVYASKATALRRFHTAVDGIVKHLEQLRSPAVTRSDYVRQIAALKGMSATASALADALTGGPHGDIQQLLVKFDRAAASTQTVAAQKAHIAAVRVYDNQSARLVKLARAAELERLRLANNLAG
jgi:hypothetical protein